MRGISIPEFSNRAHTHAIAAKARPSSLTSCRNITCANRLRAVRLGTIGQSPAISTASSSTNEPESSTNRLNPL